MALDMAAVLADVQNEDRSAIRLLIGASAIFVVLTAIHYVWAISWVAPIPRDGTTLAVGRDFLNFWMYGRAAWMPDPGRFYDPQVYNGALASLLGAGYPGQNWSYPPSIMFVAALFGRLPYSAALLLWTMLGLAIFVWVVWRRAGNRALLTAMLLAPATVFCLMSGQSSLLTAAMLLTIFSCLDRRPLLAGVLIGLLTLKPQLGLLLPVMLAASGRWRVFLLAAATALVIAGATTAVFGPRVWSDFVLNGIPVQNLVLADPERIATPFYPTIFMNIRGTGASYALAMTVQVCFSALAVAAVAFAFRFRKDADPRLLAALFFACSIAVAPYLLSYDTLPLACCAVFLLAAGRLDARGRILAKLVYWLPLIQIVLGTYHLPGPALIAPAFALYALLRLNDRAQPARATTQKAAAARA
ncbi:MAG TPA: glycosyltransferase family 87 protein [Xanthobacteraceae bacterium]|nr:glycosyltransferase family 87 protein [Xanthobacteraceae bacterium]